MTPEQIVSIGAFLLFVLFEYIPGFSGWYGNLTAVTKRLVMVGLLALAGLGSLGLSCAGLLDYFACTWQGLWQALYLIGLAIAINQGSHKLLKKPAATK